ncbi:AraC family transcriptional regulator, partial [Acinetobacter soli]
MMNIYTKKINQLYLIVKKASTPFDGLPALALRCLLYT